MLTIKCVFLLTIVKMHAPLYHTCFVSMICFVSQQSELVFYCTAPSVVQFFCNTFKYAFKTPKQEEKMKKNHIKKTLAIALSIVLLMLTTVISASAVPEKFKDAKKIDYGKTYSGKLTSNAYTDKYSFTLEKSGKIEFNIKPDTDMIRFSLSDENNYIKPEPTEDYYELSFRANDENMSLYLNAGTYYLTTQKPSFSTYTELDYSLELIFTSSNESFTETQNSNDNSAYKANQISLNSEYFGQYGMNDKEDYFKFTIPNDVELNIKYSSEISNSKCTVLDKNLKEIKSYYQEKKSIDNALSLSAGTYYFVTNYGYPLRGEFDSGDWGFYSFTLIYDIPDTEPDTSESAATEPATSEPVVTEPITTEPTTEPTTTEPIADKTSITLKKTSASVYRNGTVKIKATVKNAVGKTTYTSSNKKVAKVDKNGKVKALKKGTAKITVKNNGVKKTFKVTVKNPKLNAKKKTLKVKGKFTIKITGKNGKQTFKSNKPKIASVNKKGKVTAKKKGKAVITIKTNGGYILKLKVTVK